MIVRRRVAIISYNNVFFSQSYINCYATGHISHIVWYICLEGAQSPWRGDIRMEKLFTSYTGCGPFGMTSMVRRPVMCTIKAMPQCKK